MGWTLEKFRSEAKRLYDLANQEGGRSAWWAQHIGEVHTGGKVWAWDLMGRDVAVAIWRDLHRVLNFYEPFEVVTALAPAIRKGGNWGDLIALTVRNSDGEPSTV